MEFRIDSEWHDNPGPKALDDLQGALEQARDLWVETKPQASDAEAHASFELIAEARAAGISQPASAAKIVKGAVDTHAAIVKKNSAKLDSDHAGCVSLMNAGIKAAVEELGKAVGGGAVRASVLGRFSAAPKDGITNRPWVSLTVHVDIAG